MATRLRWRRQTGRGVVALVAVAVLAAVVYGFWPKPLLVEMGTVTRGPLEVSVREDARTRVRERWVVSAPQSGMLSRIELKAGDSLEAGDVIATLAPLRPVLLDPRAREQARSRAEAARAAVEEAKAAVLQALEAWELAEKEAARAQVLAKQGALSQQDFDRASSSAKVRQAELRSARHAVAAAERELDAAEAMLAEFDSPEGDSDEGLKVRSPVSGRVLSVLRENEGAVEMGTGLVELGVTEDLEVVADFLSTDAVAMRPGDEATILRWGGEGPLHAVVRRVEPMAFTKVSSLGIDEQRVNVLLDPVEDEEGWKGLGDGWRVEVRVVTWRGEDVLQIPLGALFRHAGEWAVFTVREGRSERRLVRLGHRGESEVQVLEGLEEKELVLLHPSDSIAPGVRVKRREGEE